MKQEEEKKYRLIVEVLNAAKEVKKLGGGRIRFVTFDEKKIMSTGGKYERQVG